VPVNRFDLRIKFGFNFYLCANKDTMNFRRTYFLLCFFKHRAVK